MPQTLTRLAQLLGVVIALAGCASPHAFHEVLVAPDQRTFDGLSRDDRNAATIREMNVDAPLILIGVEKRDNRQGVPDHHRTSPCDPGAHCLRTDKLDHTIARLDVEMRQYLGGEPTYVSHVVQFRPGGSGCALYNSYPELRFPACPSATPYDAAKGPYDSGWDAVLALDRPLRQMIAENRATHVVLLSTGWNNLQWKSIWSYRTWSDNLAAATPGDVSFRPVYVAFSWKSRGETPLSRLDLAGTRSNDASEVGYVWGGLALHRVIRPLAQEQRLKVVAIGHSYGAKLLTSALHAAPLHDMAGSTRVDALIGLQPAFSANRFACETSWGAMEFGGYRDVVGKVVMTSSGSDWANGWLGPVRFLGGKPAFDATQADGHKKVFEHGALLDSGRPREPIDCRNGRILLLDAARVVTGHTDVDDAEIANLVMSVVASCAR